MNLQLYTSEATIEPVDHGSVNIYLTDIDAAEVLFQFSAKEKLDSVSRDDITDYLRRLDEETE